MRRAITNRFIIRIAMTVCAMVLLTSVARADIVTLSTSTALGTNSVPNSNDFIGVLDGTSPEQIGGTNLNFNGPMPGGESFQIGDIVGRDIDASGGIRVWRYELNLPADAMAGTGLENIRFDAHAFERGNNNLEGDDELTWSMFFNGSATPVASGSTGAGVDFTSFDLTLLDPGGASINQVTVIFTVNGFDQNAEWFSARGVLSATYNQIPEPASVGLLLLLVSTGLLVRRR